MATANQKPNVGTNIVVVAVLIAIRPESCGSPQATGPKCCPARRCRPSACPTGIRGVIAETAFVLDVLPTAKEWQSGPPVGDVSY